MKPEIHVLGISIKTFGVTFALGFIACGALVARRLRELGKPVDWPYDIVFASLIGGGWGRRGAADADLRGGREGPARLPAGAPARRRPSRRGVRPLPRWQRARAGPRGVHTPQPRGLRGLDGAPAREHRSRCRRPALAVAARQTRRHSGAARGAGLTDHLSGSAATTDFARHRRSLDSAARRPPGPQAIIP